MKNSIARYQRMKKKMSFRKKEMVKKELLPYQYQNEELDKNFENSVGHLE